MDQQLRMRALKFEKPTLRKCTHLFYRGDSMSPTLKFPALLEIEPCRGRNVECGDVIVFNSPDREGRVVHRVVSRDAQGIRTRGDASSKADSYLLRPENIVGQVVYARTGMKRRRIHGGRVGRAIARWLRVRKALKRVLAMPLRSAYDMLSRSGIFRIWIPARFRMKIMAFNRPEGRELHLFMGRRLIGHRPAGKASWLIKPPYRLFVEVLELPEAGWSEPAGPL